MGGVDTDPFLLLDEMGPVDYGPGEATGAPDHPHRGFETVSYLLQGRWVHEDSMGHSGFLGPGDVQWMTAGSGVVHSEMPAEDLRREGGRFHGFQIWVNLPARDKMMAPRYQEIPREQIPTANSEDGLARVQVIAGEALGVQAVIETRTPVVLQHWLLKPGAQIEQPVAPDHRAYLYVFSGALAVGPEGVEVRDGQMAVMGSGEGILLSTRGSGPSEALLLAGVPLGEPVARYGPFVMNTEEEIRQAMWDYQTGQMGRIQR
ncbi:MAG TPA: pirin family protein [Deltaproteobacteria bacterium]|nr:pirin [Deltaproteobacteria bacterium]HCP44822.1 pirin family protein [Deltaproteobacteria bacterium]